MLINYDTLIEKYNVKITGVIHIGGHLGEEIPLYKKQTNNIHIFEPLEECYNQIDPTVNKYNVALGSADQILPFNVASNGESSSLLTPKTHLQEHTWVIFNRQQRMVQVRTLDSYNIADCNFLNLDVQGYELEVLKGGSRTLDTIDYIYTEINVRELYENCAQLEELDNFLQQYSRVETNLTQHGWGDAFYVKKELL